MYFLACYPLLNIVGRNYVQPELDLDSLSSSVKVIREDIVAFRYYGLFGTFAVHGPGKRESRVFFFGTPLIASSSLSGRVKLYYDRVRLFNLNPHTVLAHETVHLRHGRQQLVGFAISTILLIVWVRKRILSVSIFNRACLVFACLAFSGGLLIELPADVVSLIVAPDFVSCARVLCTHSITLSALLVICQKDQSLTIDRE